MNIAKHRKKSIIKAEFGLSQIFPAIIYVFLSVVASNEKDLLEENFPAFLVSFLPFLMNVGYLAIAALAARIYDNYGTCKDWPPEEKLTPEEKESVVLKVMLALAAGIIFCSHYISASCRGGKELRFFSVIYTLEDEEILRDIGVSCLLLWFGFSVSLKKVLSRSKKKSHEYGPTHILEMLKGQKRTIVSFSILFFVVLIVFAYPVRMIILSIDLVIMLLFAVWFWSAD